MFQLRLPERRHGLPLLGALLALVVAGARLPMRVEMRTGKSEEIVPLYSFLASVFFSVDMLVPVFSSPA